MGAGDAVQWKSQFFVGLAFSDGEWWRTEAPCVWVWVMWYCIFHISTHSSDLSILYYWILYYMIVFALYLSLSINSCTRNLCLHKWGPWPDSRCCYQLCWRNSISMGCYHPHNSFQCWWLRWPWGHSRTLCKHHSYCWVSQAASTLHWWSLSLVPRNR